MPADKTLEALSEALVDEYRARATYTKVIERFGPVHPFVNIVEAENRHINALLQQFKRFRGSPPPDSWKGRINAPVSLAQACADGVQAEIENEAMYTRLLKQVTDPQVRKVMEQLQSASRERHLPAFRRAVELHSAPGARR